MFRARKTSDIDEAKSPYERLGIPSPAERARTPLLKDKAADDPHRADPHRARGADLLSISIPRSVIRQKDTRDDSRHRLHAEQAVAILSDGREIVVDLINLSAGGAMIETDHVPELLEPVTLDLGDGGLIEGAVRWLKDGRVGLEFAAETQIACDPETRDAILLDTIRRSFPDAALGTSARAPTPRPSGDAAPSEGQRAARRHPMIWSGQVHFDHETNAVRLRNISESGALLETHALFEPGDTLLLELDGAGTIFGTVSWSRGDHVGLAFEQAFDLSRLARCQPSLTSAHAARPSSKEAIQAPSLWESHWREADIEELRDELEGFLKY